MRRETGYRATLRALTEAPWRELSVRWTELVLHEPKFDMQIAAE